MEKNLKMIYKDILNNIRPEENIPRFFNHMVNIYHTDAAVMLALNYYTLYEMYCDGGDEWSWEAKTALKLVNDIVEDYIRKQRSGSDLKEAIRLVDKTRNEVMLRMKLLTSYSDLFEIQEYVLNRVEYRFREDNKPVDDDDFTREVLRYIFDTEDNAIINDKIKEIIGQLPVRITKQKFFEMVRDCLQQYLGASEDTFDNFLYMLRSSAMLDLDQEMESYYPILWEIKAYFEQLNYKDISREDYNDACEKLKKAVILLENETALYYSLQEIINEIYAMLLCIPYAGVETVQFKKQEDTAYEILRGVSLLFRQDPSPDPDKEILQRFSLLEGVQEELSYDLTALEEALYQVDINHRKLAESIMADKLLNVLLLCRDLLSNSLFIDFYEIKTTGKVKEERISKEADRLLEDLGRLFENMDRMVVRAVMAGIMSIMPVFFNSHKEVMDYVRYSLEKCSDKAEKSACVEIINELMEA